MKRIFEFACSDTHVTDRFVDESVYTVTCECGKDAKRIVSAPRINLEGITGAFPGAYDKWERVRAERLKVERKKNAE